MSVERARKEGYFTKRSFSKRLPSPVIDQHLTSKLQGSFLELFDEQYIFPIDEQ